MAAPRLVSVGDRVMDDEMPRWQRRARWEYGEKYGELESKTKETGSNEDSGRGRGQEAQRAV